MVFLVLGLLLPAQTAQAAGSILYVDVDSTCTLSCGGSWALAYPNLQTALAAATSGDQVWVAEGVYYPGTTRASTFTLINGVAIYGGFNGTESSLSQRDLATNPTILSGDIDQNDLNTDGNFIAETPANIQGSNAYHVVSGNGQDMTAVLDSFILTAGQATGTDWNTVAGGMWNYSSSPTLTNLIFSGNSANQYGGGLGNYVGSNPTLTEVSFSGNSAGQGGGGMFNNSSSPSLTEIAFSGNSATLMGGGMYNIWTSNPALNKVTFSGNSPSYGGGISNESSSPSLTNVTFSGNTATDYGGGMYNSSSSSTLKNVTFNGNSASYGGGISNYSSSTPQIHNTIFWGNTAAIGTQIYNNSSTSGVSNSVIQDGCPAGSICTMAIITADPLLGALGDYGGFTQTVPLLAGSPAINAGNDAVCPATDQRGFARPQGTHCDIGAFESELPRYNLSGNAGVGGAILSYHNGTPRTATTNGSGDYVITVPSGWTGTITPSKTGYTFTPTSITISTPVTVNLSGQNFTAKLPPFSDILIMNGGAWNKYNFTTGSYLSGVWTGTAAGCTPALIDYDGDGTKEYSQLCGGAWHFYNKDGSYNKGIWVGNFPGSLPVPGDYNGDGVDEPILFYAGAWHYFNFTTGAYEAANSKWTGTAPGCVPAPLDYNGDGKMKFSLFCGGPWHFYNSDGSYNKGVWIGGSTSNIPVPADYDGNGTEEVVLFASGVWHFFDFATGAYDGAKSTYTGLPEASAKPTPIDYNKDGSLDFVQYATNGTWYFYNSNGSLNKSIATGSPASAVPMSRRFLP
jgi:hypothetical protein